MTTHPIDTDRESVLREDANEHQPDDHGPGICGDPECFTTCVVDGCDWPCATAWLRDQLAAAEHRATRAEAQSAIRGRAVVMYRERAREAEAERDEWRQTALDERSAALDALEQVKVRDARIKAVRAIARTYNHDIRRALDGDA